MSWGGGTFSQGQNPPTHIFENPGVTEGKMNLWLRHASKKEMPLDWVSVDVNRDGKYQLVAPFILILCNL